MPGQWPMVKCELRRPSTGERGFLLFSEFTLDGELGAPHERTLRDEIWHRLTNRDTSKRIGNQVLYQTQAWVVHGHLLDDADKQEIELEFRNLRAQLREQLLTDSSANGDSKLKRIVPK